MPRLVVLMTLTMMANAVVGFAAPASPPILTIVAGSARFGSVEAAAGGEERVDWSTSESLDADACTESFGATELRRFLARALRRDEREIALTSAPTLPVAGDVIVLGSRRSNPLVASLVHGRAPTAPQSFRIVTHRRDGRRVFVIEGHDRAGTLYGGYAFLNAIGVRFDGLGNLGVTLPSAGVLPRDLGLEEAPAFTTRGFWAWEPRGNREFFLWMARNRMNLWTAAEPNPAFLKKLGIQLVAGGHTIQAEFLDPAEYFQAHPEWFGLRGGVRSANIKGEFGDNYCTSNHDATRELARNLVRSLASGRMRYADRVELWMLDGGAWCECEACRAQGSPSDRTVVVLRQVAAAIAEARRAGLLERNVEIGGAAYLETLPPPSAAHRAAASEQSSAEPAGMTSITAFPYYRCYAHALADTSCHEINHRLAPNVAAWARTSRETDLALGIGEYYNVSWFSSLPLVFPHVTADDIRWYRTLGARSFHYMHVPTRLWGTWALNHDVMAALLWRPSTDVDSLIAAFCQARYPTTARPMRAFLGDLELASANIFAVEHCIGALGRSGRAGRLAVRSFPVLPLQHLQLDARGNSRNRAPAWSEILAAMHRARLAIDEASRACADSAECQRIAEDERRFEYGELAFRLYDAIIRTALADHAGDDPGARRAFAPAEGLAPRLRKLVDVVQVASSHANATDGLAATHLVNTYEYFRARYGSEKK